MLEPITRTLRIENLNQKVTEKTLKDVLETISPTEHVKIVKNKADDPNHGLVKFHDRQGAEQVLHVMDKRAIYGDVVSMHWERLNEKQAKLYYIFVGNLAPETSKQELSKAFSSFPSMADAKVTRHHATQRSMGHGCVAFHEQSEAERAIATMHGATLGTNVIRCEWWEKDAKEKKQAVVTKVQSIYAEIFAATSLYNTTIKIDNLPSALSDLHLVSYFQQHGTVTGIRVETDQEYALVKMDTHSNAANAIFAMNDTIMAGQRVRLAWAEDGDGDSVAALPSPSPKSWIFPTHNHHDFLAMHPPVPLTSSTGMPGEWFRRH